MKANFIIVALLWFSQCCGMPQELRDKDFVYLHEIDSSIILSPRYATQENFVGVPIIGYERPYVIVTKLTALALKKVQEYLKKDGYSLVVYDGYRPQRSVNHFVAWGNDQKNQIKKSEYYPRVNKSQVFDLGYVYKKSGHTRGSTVDLTIIKVGDALHPIKRSQRKLLDGFTITYLDDGTVDMGSSFDLFDKASYFENDLLGEPYKSRRKYLRTVMEQHGFKGCTMEWWHFALKDEPYPKDQDTSYFDYVIS